jgi:inositol hexakisphosphate/diphosphoinositol-pentakisphosphate kinase
MEKILIDLRNTREEAKTVAEVKHNQEAVKGNLPGKCQKLPVEGPRPSAKARVSAGNSRQNCYSNKSFEMTDDDDEETQYRLDPKQEGVELLTISLGVINILLQ